MPPAVPTALQVTSIGSDTTPSFSCVVGANCRAVFFLYIDGVLGSFGDVSSDFTVPGGVVTAEYTTPLSLGNYEVAAMAVDTLADKSSLTSRVDFSIIGTVTKDLEILYDVWVLINKDLQIIYGVSASNIKDLEILYNVLEVREKDLELLWAQDTPWSETDYGPTTWTPVNPP